MVRLFYAVEIDDGIKRSLAHEVIALRNLGRHVRPVGSHGMHITLLFLGEQPDNVLEDFIGFGHDAVAMARPCKLEIGPAGFFPRVSFLTLIGEIETLLMVSSMLKQTCSGYLERPDDREFKAHLTLARHKQKISMVEKEVIRKAFAGFKGQSWLVNEIVLIKSDLTPKGAVYTAIERFKFGSG
jgi:2'-5' RNA ligase